MFLVKDLPNHQRLRVQELTSHVHYLFTKPTKLSEDQLQQYQKDGFVIYRNIIDKNLLQAMRITSKHIYENPNGLLQYLNGTNYCGQSFYNFLTLDFWRKIMFKLPLSVIAASLMDTSQVVYALDVLMANSLHCFKENMHLSTGVSHADINLLPFSIEKKALKFYYWRL